MTDAGYNLTGPCTESCLYIKDSTPPESIRLQICGYTASITIQFQGKGCIETFSADPSDSNFTAPGYGVYDVVKPSKITNKKCNDGNSGLNPNIKVDLDDADVKTTEIHTSCSQPIALGRGFEPEPTSTTCTDGPIYVIAYLNDRDDPNSGGSIPPVTCPGP